MSEKTLRIIIGAVVVLVAAYALAAMIGGSPSSASGDDARALVRALEDARKDDLEAIRIVGPEPGDSTELVRGADGTWSANGKPADSAAVARLMDALEEARVGHLAAANPDNHARLGVAADSTWQLELRRAGADEPIRLLLGENGPSYPSVYARLPDADEVFVVSGTLGNAARRRAADWRDRVVVRADTAAVRRIVVTRDKATYTLARGDSARWTVDGAPADSGTVAELLRELARLEAQAFAPDSATLDKVTRSVLALGEAGDTLALVRAAPTEQSWTWRAAAAGKGAASGLGGDVFELAGWRVDRIAPEKGKVAGSGG
ncbi:MAG TPA: DUF4340 domain-containing protein [Longimicrobiales bacterium]